MNTSSDSNYLSKILFKRELTLCKANPESGTGVNPNSAR